MWDETNFLIKGFINEVKGALTESGGGGSSGSSFEFSSKAGGVPGNGIRAVSVLDLSTIVFASSAGPSEA